MMEPCFFEGVGGVRIAADIGGPVDGPAVVLLHGGGQTRQSWGGTAETLAASGYRVVTLDARGHGESGWAPGGIYDMEGFVGDLCVMMDTLRGKPALVGASLGGLTAMLAIGEADHPIASALVLVDIAPKMNRAGTAKIQAFMQANPEGFSSLDEAADAVEAYLPQRRRPRSTEGLRRNLRLDPASGRYRWHWDPAFMAPRQWGPEIQRRFDDAARNVAVPTLLVRGSASEVVDDEAIRHFQELVPHAKVAELEGAGHMVAGDSNDAFNQAILPFLAASWV
ncbi:MAG TPA: alpha/beta hydrolase [Alphaproteobacteria bacterium]|jgi:non-heme chloroperoxidase|nr:alpha/beta hydrolase [Alphaproteobacteria bacterium]